MAKRTRSAGCAVALLFEDQGVTNLRSLYLLLTEGETHPALLGVEPRLVTVVIGVGPYAL